MLTVNLNKEYTLVCCAIDIETSWTGCCLIDNPLNFIIGIFNAIAEWFCGAAEMPEVTPLNVTEEPAITPFEALQMEDEEGYTKLDQFAEEFCEETLLLIDELSEEALFDLITRKNSDGFLPIEIAMHYENHDAVFHLLKNLTPAHKEIVLATKDSENKTIRGRMKASFHGSSLFFVQSSYSDIYPLKKPRRSSK